LESQFTEIAESQPELLARHCAEAGLIEKAASLWGKAGQRSLARSAIVEAAEQLTRALDQIATLPATPVLRREQIKFQIALANALMHVKGYVAPEPKAPFEQARVFIEHAETLGEPPEDPLLLFSVLWGFWNASYVAFNGNAIRDLAAQILALAEKQGSTVPLMIGYRLTGASLLHTGGIAGGLAHLDRAIALYDPAAHRPLAPRYGVDMRVAALAFRSLALWLLGYPVASLASAAEALRDGREIGHAPSLMAALFWTSLISFLCGDTLAAIAHADELVALAESKRTPFLKSSGMYMKCLVMAQTRDKASEAVQMISSELSVARSNGSTVYVSFLLSKLARAYENLGRFDDARRVVREAMTAVETTKESWCEAEINRVGGEIALTAIPHDPEKAGVYFDRALAIARKQKAKSWELRAAMSMARLWRDQGKRDEARDLLAPVYGWFCEGFDTLDLKEAKTLLEQFVS
jgi:predicted ATPase